MTLNMKLALENLRSSVARLGPLLPVLLGYDRETVARWTDMQRLTNVRMRRQTLLIVSSNLRGLLLDLGVVDEIEEKIKAEAREGARE